MFLFSKLNALVSAYMSESDREVIAKTFLLAAEAHIGQKRASGLCYITHPVEVACILSELKMDIDVVLAGLLHDVVEDTNFSIDMIHHKYGTTVANLVSGVTKVKKIKSINSDSKDNFIKMLFATIKDERVIVLKLADRLHNIRTIEFLPTEKQKIIAKQTLEIYAPLAYRIGLQEFHKEFYSTSFKILYPFRCAVLERRLEEFLVNKCSIFEQVLSMLKKHLSPLLQNINQIIGRQKSVHSIYKKMVDKNCNFIDIKDIYAYKIIAESRNECYTIMGYVHSLFQPIYGKIKDFIACPKINGYQSLHTTVIGPYNIHLEIQIQTREMNYMSIYGIAGHSLYKTAATHLDVKNIKSIFSIINNIKYNLDANQISLEHVNNRRMIFVFTPQNSIIELPENSSCIDFAYSIHTKIGETAFRAIINNRTQALSHKLKNGDKVEIINSDVPQVNIKWLSLAQTPLAKKCIKSALKKRGKRHVEQLGKIELDHIFNDTVPCDIINRDKIIQKLLEYTQSNNVDELYYRVGTSDLNKLIPIIHKYKEDILSSYNKSQIYLDANMKKYLAPCCKPVKGEKIFMSETTSLIHSGMCPIAIYKEEDKEIFWPHDLEMPLTTQLVLQMKQSPFSTTSVTKIIGHNNVPLLHFTAKPHSDFIEIEILVEVDNITTLDNIIHSLRQLSNCLHISRHSK